MALQNFLSGTVAGLATLLVGQPFDTVKVRLQTTPRSELPSMWECARQCWRCEGIRGFYKGTSPQVVAAGFQHGVRYGSFGLARDYLEGQVASPLLLGALCGAVTGCAVSLIATPIELIKCRQQVVRHENVTMTRAVSQAIRSEGVMGLYRGFGWTLLRSVLGNVAAFGTYQFLVTSGVAVTLAGGTAGLSFWTIGYPADVLKSQAQTGQHSTRVTMKGLLRPSHSHPALSTCHSAFRILWRGYAAVLLRAFPTNAAAFTAYEACSTLFET